MKTVALLISLTLSISVFAKTKPRLIASVNEDQIVATLIAKVSAMPKNKITIRQKFKKIAEYLKCEKLSENYTREVQERMSSHMKNEEISGTITLPKEFGLFKCKSDDGDKLLALVKGNDIGENDDSLANVLILSTSEYSANLDEVDYDDLLGSDSLWLFHSENKKQNAKQLRVKISKNSIKGVRFEEFLSEKANVYFK